MRKALLPMIASLALCGTATAALIATNARAEQSIRKPVMVALVTPDDLAANAPHGVQAAPPSEMAGPPPEAMRDMAARRDQFCKDMYARRVGELAYFEAKLTLTAAQAPLFDHWRQATLDVAKRRSGECGTGERHARNGKMPTLVDRMAKREDRLKHRLADLESQRPALEALYTSLNPQQRAELSHGIARLEMARGMMERHMMGHRMMMGMMGGPRGPEMGRGRMAPMGAPPAPAAQ
jgi:LTXXQ motif family protein